MGTSTWNVGPAGVCHPFRQAMHGSQEGSPKKTLVKGKQDPSTFGPQSALELKHVSCFAVHTSRCVLGGTMKAASNQRNFQLMRPALGIFLDLQRKWKAKATARPRK